MEIDIDKILRKLLIKLINPKFNFSIFPIMIHHFISRNFTFYCVQFMLSRTAASFQRDLQQQFWEKEWKENWPQVRGESDVFYHFQKYYNSRARRHWIDPRTICHLLHQQMFYFSLLLLAFYQVLVFLFQFVSGFVKLLFPLIITEKRSATCVKITVPMSWATVGGVTINRFIDRHFCTIRMF